MIFQMKSRFEDEVVERRKDQNKKAFCFHSFLILKHIFSKIHIKRIIGKDDRSTLTSKYTNDSFFILFTFLAPLSITSHPSYFSHRSLLLLSHSSLYQTSSLT